MAKRVIGQFNGVHSGLLVLVFGAMHGNESAGVRALEELFQLLTYEASNNPGFVFKGKLLGLTGNLQAFTTGQRFLEKDLNRQWTIENLQRILGMEPAGLYGEDREIAELYALIHKEIREAQAETLVLLDLHTTSAEGGIFCIPTDDKASLRLAKELHAPVILGLLEGIKGTLLHFAAGNHFFSEGHPKFTIGAAFEAGQHDDPLSVTRSVSAIIACLQACGCIGPTDVVYSYDDILLQYGAALPKVTSLRHVHHIRPGDGFKMRPGYVNFQPVQSGEHLADDVRGPVLSPDKGLILMPLYQSKGSDGFFIVDTVD